ncbi:diguanylate cyclase [Acuticoccus kandeliae]|uniref:diguanylate cyclase n=1 Tax=Acuticoccus kandeliae TaxID=2073160 RepID=UPI000D3E7E22|nr:diguanylate cyclase [Acuticoccus kandeliae]
MRICLRVLLLLACISACFLAGPAGAQEADGASEPPPVTFSTLEEGRRLFGNARLFRDPDHDLSFEEVLEAEEEEWHLMQPEMGEQGITTDAFWLRFTIRNDSDNDQRLVVSHDIANLSDFDAYVRGPNGLESHTDFDPNAPFRSREIAYAGPAAPIAVPAGEAREVYVSFYNEFAIPIHVNVRLWSEDAFDDHTIEYTAFYTFWIASLLMNALFWVLYAVVMRQMRIIMYSLYMVSLAVTYLGFFGIGFQLLYASMPWIQAMGYHWSMFLALAAATDFARRHLEIDRLHPRQNTLMLGAIALFLFGAGFAIVARRPEIEAPITFIGFAIVPAYICWRSFVAWRSDRLSYAGWMFFGWFTISLTILFTLVGSLVEGALTDWSNMDFIRLAFSLTVLESLLLSVSLAQWLRSQERRLLAAEQAAARDALTGLLNRRGFSDRIADIKSDRIRWPGDLWLAVIDIDRFKQINDTHNHAGGDAVLVHLAHLLQRECRADDIIARFGGEEFVVLFSARSESAARAFIDRIRVIFDESPTVFENRPIAHTLSAGIVRVADVRHGDERELIARADDALYRAKRAGRDRVFVGATGPAGLTPAIAE